MGNEQGGRGESRIRQSPVEQINMDNIEEEIPMKRNKIHHPTINIQSCNDKRIIYLNVSVGLLLILQLLALLVGYTEVHKCVEKYNNGDNNVTIATHCQKYPPVRCVTIENGYCFGKQFLSYHAVLCHNRYGKLANMSLYFPDEYEPLVIGGDELRITVTGMRLCFGSINYCKPLYSNEDAVCRYTSQLLEHLMLCYNEDLSVRYAVWYNRTIANGNDIVRTYKFIEHNLI